MGGERRGGERRGGERMGGERMEEDGEERRGERRGEEGGRCIRKETNSDIMIDIPIRCRRQASRRMAEGTTRMTEETTVTRREPRPRATCID